MDWGCLCAEEVRAWKAVVKSIVASCYPDIGCSKMPGEKQKYLTKGGEKLKMNKFKTGLNLISGIISLVHFAESYFKDTPKSGKEKAAMVLQGTKLLAAGMEQATTGGARSTWSKIEAAAPAFIDKTAGILYPPK